MAQVEHLVILESAEADGDRLVEISVAMGELEAIAIISRSADILHRGLDNLRHAYRQDDFVAVAEQAKALAQIADNIGLTQFGRVAGDVEACALAGAPTPLAATITRLSRLAGPSIRSVWELQENV